MFLNIYRSSEFRASYEAILKQLPKVTYNKHIETRAIMALDSIWLLTLYIGVARGVWCENVQDQLVQLYQSTCILPLFNY